MIPPPRPVSRMTNGFRRWCKENNCPFDRRYTCAAAAGRGHVDVVKWLQSNGCPWGKSTCEWAAGGGPIEKPVRWWNYKGAPDRLDTLGADPLDLSGSDLESGKRGGGSYWWYNIAGQAQKPRVKNQMRQLLVLKWCRRNGCPWDKKTCVNAAERGYLKVCELVWCSWCEVGCVIPEVIRRHKLACFCSRVCVCVCVGCF